MDLENLKYNELQKLAKSAGIRANMKVEKLVKALKEHYLRLEEKDGSGKTKADQPESSQSNRGDGSGPAEDGTKESSDSGKKAAVKGKKPAKRGARGKNKKNVSDNTQANTPKVQSWKPVTPSVSKTPQRSTPAVQPAWKKTQYGGTLGLSVRNTPGAKIVKPVSSNTPQRKPLLAGRPSSAQTPQAKAGQTHKAPASGTTTPALFSPKVQKKSSANRKLSANGNKSGGKIIAAGTSKSTPNGLTTEKKGTPTTISSKWTPMGVAAAKQGTPTTISSKWTPMGVAAEKKGTPTTISSKWTPMGVAAEKKGTPTTISSKWTPMGVAAEKKGTPTTISSKWTPMGVAAAKKGTPTTISSKWTPMGVAAEKKGTPTTISSKWTPMGVAAAKQGTPTTISSKWTPMGVAATKKGTPTTISSKWTPMGVAATKKGTPTTISSKWTPMGVAATKQGTPMSSGGRRRSSRNGSENGSGASSGAGVEAAKAAGQKRKRKSTFELEEATLGTPATPEVGQADKRGRTSPGVQDMLDSMSGEMSSAERRQRLMNVINKKVESKAKKSPHAGPATQIPRFAAFLAKKKQEQKKPITPGNKDWEKLHKKEFAKFDSIDVYLDKKRKRAEEMTASVKKARTVLHEVQEAVTKLKSNRTPTQGKKSIPQPFKPSVVSTKNMNLNFGVAASNKTPSDRKSTAKPFKPSVTSTKDMNLNFSSFRTPVNPSGDQSACASTSSRRTRSGEKSAKASQMSARKSLGAVASAAKKTSSAAPFYFTGNLTMSAAKSASKPTFDLKASLARPITWKVHTGKLKPVDSLYNSNNDLQKSSTKPAVSRMDIFKSSFNKSGLSYSRKDRRAAAAKKRADQKGDLQMKRRGLSAAP